jgi:uncharacterized protein (TIGR03643 family)
MFPTADRRHDPVRQVKSMRDPAVLDEIIQMALSDHISFQQIRELHGLSPDEVQALMRRELKSNRYVAWRKRVKQFADRRQFYK